VAAHSETIVADEDVMIVVDEDVMIEEDATKNSTIEMIGFALHVRMTTFLSELNVINAENPAQEDNPVVETEEAEDAVVIVEDAEETEEVDSAEDAMVIVEDAEETEEVDSAEDAMVIVEDVEETEIVVEEMSVLENSIGKLVESDQVMLITDHQKKSNHADINDVITMIIKVKS
jgi:hypothetical protein